MFGDRDTEDRLSTWFPAVQKVLPVGTYPATVLVRVPAGCDLIDLLDGKTPDGFDPFLNGLTVAASQVGGFPIFLRADLISGKHEPSTPCIVWGPGQLGSSIASIVEATELARWDAEGTDIWAVRELLTGFPVMTAFGWFQNSGLPIGPERRYIVKDGAVADHFPYWPARAVTRSAKRLDGTPLSDEEIAPLIASISQETASEIAELSEWSVKVAAELTGDWSVDWMLTTKGWQLIDAARAERSWVPSDQDEADLSALLVATTEEG